MQGSSFITPLVISVLSASAGAISSILLKQSIKGGAIAGCGAQSGCDAVQKSRWARIGPLPVATLGITLYSMLLGSALVEIFVPLWRDSVEFALAVMAWAIGGSALWFTLLQLIVIRRICVLCMSIHLLGASTALLVLHPFTGLGILQSAIVGGISVLALILLQLLFPPKRFRSILPSELTALGAKESGPPSEILANQTLVNAERGGSISLVGGRARINLDEWPILDAPQAKQTVGVLFDITCEECRRLYRLLQQSRLSSDTTYVLIPVPRHPACNPAVQPTPTQNPSACEFARLYLTLWQLDRKAFVEFERWLMTPIHPPAYLDARKRAMKSVDSMKLTMALMDGRIDSRISTAVALYQSLDIDTLPQLLLPDRLVVGNFATLKEMTQELGKEPSLATV